MGCDMRVEPYRIDEWGTVHDMREVTNRQYLDWRSYDMYSFLADVRNEGNITPIVEPRNWPSWLPPQKPFDPYTNDALGPWCGGWLTISELLEFDYSKTCQTGETYRELLGDGFFSDLLDMYNNGVTHIVMWFSS